MASLQRLLRRAFLAGEVSGVQHAFDLLLDATRSGALPKSAELLVLAAEAGVSNELFDAVAQRACDQFFMDNPPQNQFYCRALFARALVEAWKARPLNGASAVRQLLHAVQFILQALDIALKPENRPRYDFIVYNSTVHLWNVVRPLMRPGVRRFGAGALGRACDALGAVDDVDAEWRAMLLVQVTLSLEDEAQMAASEGNGEKADESMAAAKARVDAALEQCRMATGTSAAELMCDVQRLHVHLAGGSGDADGGASTSDTVRRKLQVIRSGTLPQAEVLAVIHEQLNLIDPAILDPSAGAPEQQKEGVAEDLGAGGPENPEAAAAGVPANVSVDCSAVVYLGRLALSRCAHVETAERCANYVEGAKSTKSEDDVNLDYLRCQLLTSQLESALGQVDGPGGKQRRRSARSRSDSRTGGREARGTRAGKRKMDARRVAAMRVARRIEALKVLDRALLSCKRLGKPDLLQDGCVLAWNLGLPLLQPHLRKHVHRVYQIAATALEEIDSPLRALRAHFHMEIAKCEVASDFLAKAQTQVGKAISLDYGSVDTLGDSTGGTPTGSPEVGTPGADHAAASLTETVDAKTDRLRPLDKFLLPLKAKLELKASLYKDPDTPEEQALLQVEQAKEARDVHIKATLLARAAGLLELGDAAEDQLVEKNQAPAPSADLLTVPEPDSEAAGVASGKGKGRRVRAAGKKAGEKRSVPPAGDQDSKTNYANDLGGPSVSRPSAVSDKDKERTVLWGEIATLAWQHRLVALTHRAAPRVLSRRWDPSRFRSFTILQAEIHFIHAESYVYQLSKHPRYSADDMPRVCGLDCRALGIYSSIDSMERAKRSDAPEELSDPPAVGGGHDEEEEEEHWEEEFEAIKVKIIDELLAGMRLGQSLGASGAYLVENAAVYLWNYHLHLFKERSNPVTETSHRAGKQYLMQCSRVFLPQLVGAIKETHTALLRFPIRSRDTLDDGNAEPQTGGDGSSAKDAETFMGPRTVALLCCITASLARIHEARGELAEAEHACLKCLVLCRRTKARETEAGVTKDVVATLVRVRAATAAAQGATNYADATLMPAEADTYDGEAPKDGNTNPASGPRAFVFSVLEICDNPSVVAEEKWSVLQRAVETLAAAPCGGDDAGREAASKAAVEANAAAIGPDSDAVAAEARNRAVALHAEMWARLARAAHDLGHLPCAQRCCAAAIRALPDDVSNRRAAGGTSAKAWRWYSVAECVWGKTMRDQIVPEKQEKPLQDELRQASLQHFVLAAQWGGRAGARLRPALVLDAAHELWNVCLPFMGAAVTRRLLAQPLREVLLELANANETKDLSFRVRLYRLLFQCFSDKEDWAGGLAVVDEAFQQIPQALQKSLWEARVVFSSKLGKDVAAGLHKMKEGDPSVQAKAWATLARSSASLADQMAAYTSALDALGDSFERVDYLIEYGEWLFCNNFSLQDARDALLSAADLLLDAVHGNPSGDDPWGGMDDDDEEDDEEEVVFDQIGAGGGRSRRGGSRLGDSSRLTRSRSNMRKDQSSHVGSRRRVSSHRAGGVPGSYAGSQSVRSGKQPGSRRGLKSTVTRGSQRKGGTERHSRHGSKATRRTGKTGVSTMGGASGRIDGVSGGASGSFPEFGDCGHLEKLVTVFTMLAECESSWAAREDRLLVAQYYAARLWQVSVRSANARAAAARVRQRKAVAAGLVAEGESAEDAEAAAKKASAAAKSKRGKAKGGKGGGKGGKRTGKGEVGAAGTEEAAKAAKAAAEKAAHAAKVAQRLAAITCSREEVEDEIAASENAGTGYWRVPDVSAPYEWLDMFLDDDAPPMPLTPPDTAGESEQKSNEKLDAEEEAAAHSAGSGTVMGNLRSQLEKGGCELYTELGGARGTICRSTVARPAVSAHYLIRLSDLLHEHGFGMHSLPVLQLLKVVALDICDPPCRDLADLASLMRARALDRLGKTSAAEFAVSAVLPRLQSLSETQRIKYGEEVAQREQQAAQEVVAGVAGTHRQRQLERQGQERQQAAQQRAAIAAAAARAGNPGNGGAKLGALAVSAVTGKTLPSLPIETVELGGMSGEPPVKRPRRAASVISVRDVWSRQAVLLIDVGFPSAARARISEVERHNEAFDDQDGVADSLVTRSVFTFLEGDIPGAIDAAIAAQRTFAGDTDVAKGANVRTWVRSTRQLVICLRAAGRRQECKAVLEHASKAFTEVARERSVVDVDLDAVLASCAFAQCELAAELEYEAIGHRSRGSPWRGEWERAESLLNEARTRLEAVECTGAVLALLLQHARMLLREAEGVSEHRHGIAAVRGAAVRPAPAQLRAQFPRDNIDGPFPAAGAALGVFAEPGQDSEAISNLLARASEMLSAAHAHAHARFKAVWPADCPAEVCPPAKRDLAAVEACLARLAMCKRREVGAGHRSSPDKSVTDCSQAVAAEKQNPVGSWLKATAPIVEPTDIEMGVQAASRAVLHLSGALNLVGATAAPPYRARLLAQLGIASLACAHDEVRCRPLHDGSGALAQRVWDVPKPALRRAQGCHSCESTADGTSDGGKAARNGKSDRPSSPQLALDTESAETSEASEDGPSALSAAERRPPTCVRTSCNPNDRLFQQACAHLSEAVALGTNNSDAAGAGEDDICAAACALADCYGATDFERAAESVCRAQSWSARARLRRLFLRACAPNNRQALFLKLLAHLANGHTMSTDMRLAEEARRVLSHLSVAWRRLDISADFGSLRDSLPSNTAVVVLTLPPNQSALYGAVFTRPNPAVESARNAVHEAREFLANLRRNSSENGARTEAEKAEEREAEAALLAAEEAASALYGVDCAVARQSLGAERHASLVALAADCSAWRKQLAPFLMRYEVDHPGDECDADGDESGASSHNSDRFDAELHALLARTEAIVGSLFSDSPVISALLAQLTKNNGHVILCVPELLETLPLEGLKTFAGAGVVARDFSAHLFHHRSAAFRSDGGKPCSATATAIVADPRHEDKSTSAGATGNAANMTILETLAATRSKIPIGGPGEDETNKEGNVLTGTSQIPSTGQWQRLLAERDGGGFVYYGLGRMLAYLAPEFVAGLDLSRCPIAILLDRALNDAANRRQSKADNQKSKGALELEGPSATAAILSLAGINTIVLNQWGASFAHNSRMCQELFPLLKKGICVGEAVTQACRTDKSRNLRSRISTAIYGLPNVLMK